MITVMELLSHPVFRDFELVTDRSGIYNRVRNSGIFEWEDEKMIVSSFHKGDFLATTLIGYKDDPDEAMKMIGRLLDRQLSALCIKRIYFDRLSPEIIERANEKHIPVFFFSDTYFDDIIFTIKNAVTYEEINRAGTLRIRQLLYDDPDDISSEMLISDINPLFHEELICGWVMPKDSENSEAILEKHNDHLQKSVKTIPVVKGVIWSIFRFPKGMLIIYTDNRQSSESAMQSGLLELGKTMDFDLDDYAIGMSNKHAHLSELGTAIKESVYASVDARIVGERIRYFSEIGLLQIICPLRNNYWMKTYYERMWNMLTSYDELHSSDLAATLMAYVHCKGNINETAEEMFQHANTIRYRLNQISSVLGISNSIDKKTQLFMLARLHTINDILKDERI